MNEIKLLKKEKRCLFFCMDYNQMSSVYINAVPSNAFKTASSKCEVF